MKTIDVMLLAQANELELFRSTCAADPMTKEQRVANARLQEDIASSWAMNEQANRADPFFPRGAE